MLLAWLLNLAWAQPVSLSPIGEHYPVLVIEKNENPQNQLVVYVQLDEHCQFKGNPRDPTQPLLDYYWLMDGRRYKPVHPLIKSGIRSRLQFRSLSQDRRTLIYNFHDLHELKHDLRSSDLRIVAHNEQKTCAAETWLELGPSDGNRKMILRRVDSIATKTWLPPFRKLQSLKLIGALAIDHTPFEKSLLAR